MTAFESLEQPLAVARAAGLLGMLLVNGAHMSEAIQVLEQAIAGLGDEAPELRANLEARLARAYMRTSDPAAAVAAADRALPFAEQHGLEVVVAEAMLNKGSAYSFMGRLHEAVALLQAAVRLAERVGEPTIQLRGLNNLASAIYGTDSREAGRLYEQAVEVAERFGQRGLLNFLAPNIAGHRYFSARDWDDALALLERTYEAAGSDADRARQLVENLEIRVARDELAPGELERLVELASGIDDPPFHAHVSAVRSRAAMLGGDLGAAVTYAREAFERDPGSGAAIFHFVQAACWSGDVQLVREAAERADGFRRMGEMTEALRLHSQAALAAAEGRRREAVTGFKDSIGLFFSIGSDFAAAMLTIDALMMVPGEPELLDLGERAAAIFERVAAKRYLAWLERAMGDGRAASVSGAAESAGSAVEATTAADHEPATA